MPTATLTSKGQVTIPLEIRQRLKLKSGQRVDFDIDASGQVVLKPRHLDIRELKGIVRSSRKRPVTLKQMEEAVAEGFSRG